MSISKNLTKDKLEALDGIDAAIRVSLKWLENSFSDIRNLHEDHSVDAIKNPLVSALMAVNNLQTQINLWSEHEQATNK